MAGHTEFKTAVTVFVLEEPEYQPCPELQEICRLIAAPAFDRSPAELFPSDQSYRSVSYIDRSCFLDIDITHDPTDPMCVVPILIRCPDSVAEQVDAQLRRIRDRSSIKTAFLRGNLGLSRNMDST